MRPDWRLSVIIPFLFAWPLSAAAEDNDTTRIVAECGSQELPQSSVDSCLERVRVIDETEPSADLQRLESTLERRASRQTPARPAREAAAEASPPSATFSLRGDASDEAGVPPAKSAASPEWQQLAGPGGEDEPPIADADDTPLSPDGTQAANDDDPE